MSLGGLALGVGMLVDNSIVVLEAIDRHRRRGLDRRQAARVGGSEVTGAVTAATLTTISVFVPIVFVRGVAGQLFYDLAVTVCFSLAASLIVSLTMIPALAAFDYRSFSATREVRLYQPAIADTRPWTLRAGPFVIPPIGDGRSLRSRAFTILLFLPRLLFHLSLWLLDVLYRLLALLIRVLAWATGIAWWAVAWAFHGLTWPLKKLLDGLGHAYPRALDRSLRYRWVILPVAFGLFALSLGAIPLLGTNLVPDLAQGEFAFRLHLPEGTGLTTTAGIVERIEGRLVSDARFSRVFSSVGSLPSTASGRQTIGENLAQINFVLAADADAELEAGAVERVRDVLDLFPSVEAELIHPSVLTVKPPVALNVFSDDLLLLDLAAERVGTMVSGIDGLEDVSTTAEPGSPEITLEIDRDRAATLGVTADELSRSLRRQIRGEVVGQFREAEDRIDIRLRASERSRDQASEVASLRFRLPNGTAVPVSAVARVEIGRGPAAIHRVGGARVAQITAQVSAADLGRTLEEVRARIPGMALPANTVVELAGQDRELKISFDSLKLALALAVFLVYVVMAIQFESIRYPFVILLAVPLGIIGVIAALLALIGSVMLAGIVVNNAIVLVDAVNRRRRQGETLDAAIVGAGSERLRPILMTTATTVLALLPMALGLGAGNELRRPLAITVIGGLTAATLLTLIVIPCLYRAISPGRVGVEAGAEALDPALGVGEEASG
jgi:HAE1 family hydrophobic/amphiphilic exporter-1